MIRIRGSGRDGESQCGAQGVLFRFFDEAELFGAGGGRGVGVGVGVGVPGEVAVALPAADGWGGRGG